MPKIPLPPVLSAEGLEHVATHKYVPGKYTPLDNLLNPFWYKLADLLPMWLAPNLVTLLGFLPMIVSYGLAWYYSPHFNEPAPRWLAIYTCLATFVYQTMDALDGKQARRTGSSTPLGQLFDHGCDCLACLSHHSVVCMVMLPGPDKWVVAGLSALQTAFFFAQWQEYHTGVLRTSFGPVGVTETQFGVIFGALLSAILGPEVMRDTSKSLQTVPWSSTPLPNGVIFVQMWIGFVATLTTISFYKTFMHAFKEKGVDGFLLALRQLLPMLLMNLILFNVWSPAVFEFYPRQLCFFTGALFFYYTAQMILFSMAKMPFRALQPTLIPYFAVAVLSRVVSVAQLPILLALADLWVGVWVFMWLSRVLEELKKKLGIRAFRIKPKSNN